MARYIPSPLIMQWWVISLYLVKRLPSISNAWGRWLNWSNARCIARKEARRMFISSISCCDTTPMAYVSASASISLLSSFRTFSDSCLLSLRVLFLYLGGRITAAAKTGPARHPRPASSQPASTIPLVWKLFNANAWLLSYQN